MRTNNVPATTQEDAQQNRALLHETLHALTQHQPHATLRTEAPPTPLLQSWAGSRGSTVQGGPAGPTHSRMHSRVLPVGTLADVQRCNGELVGRDNTGKEPGLPSKAGSRGSTGSDMHHTLEHEVGWLMIRVAHT